MKLALCLLAALASMALVAMPPDRVSLRVATGRRFARVTVHVDPRPENRLLVVMGQVEDEEGELLWYRRTDVQLEGDMSRRQHVIPWNPAPGLLQVRADVVGLCGSAQGAAFVGW